MDYDALQNHSDDSPIHEAAVSRKPYGCWMYCAPPFDGLAGFRLWAFRVSTRARCRLFYRFASSTLLVVSMYAVRVSVAFGRSDGLRASTPS